MSDLASPSLRCLFTALIAVALGVALAVALAVALGAALLAAAPAFAQSGAAGDDDFANGFSDFIPDVEPRPLDELLDELPPLRADTSAAIPPAPAATPIADPAPQTPPAEARWVVQERAGLAIEIPETMTMQWDDHDIVLFSDGRAFDDNDGLYAALFLGEAEELDRLADGATWAEQSRELVDLPGAGRFHRMMLRLNPDHGEGSGQVLMSEARGADGRHRLAFVLAANRPYSGPEVARILGSLAAADPASPDAYGPPPPDAPEGWTRQVRLGLSFAVPPGFSPVELDPDGLFLVRGLDVDRLMSQGPSLDNDGMMITVSRLTQQDMANPDMVIARDTVTLADGQVFLRVEAAEIVQGVTVRGHMLQSDLRDSADRAIGLGIVAYNPADPDAFRAEAETIMATMRLRPSPHFDAAITEAQLMGGLFEVHLPRGWRIYMRRSEQVLILTPSGFVALTTGDPARFALGLSSHDDTPSITDGRFLGQGARLAEGRASPQALAGGGVITTIALDTCLANGDPIAIAIASHRAWQGTTDYTAFIDALHLNLPDDAIPCRPAMGAAATAADRATATPPPPLSAPATPSAPASTQDRPATPPPPVTGTIPDATKPPLTATPPPPPPGATGSAIEIPAADYVRGCDVAPASGQVALYGKGVLVNAPPYSERPNCAEYRFLAVAAGSYRLEIEYASAQSRPVRVILNGALVSDSAIAGVTGCWTPECQRWTEVGVYQLNAGFNTLLLERSAVFPHIRALRWVPVSANEPTPGQRGARLLGVVTRSDADYVSAGEQIAPNGRPDAQFRIAVQVPGDMISAIEIRSTSGPFSVWDTISGNGYWTLAAVSGGRLLSRTDTSVSIPLDAVEMVLDLFVEAPGDQVADGRTGYSIFLTMQSGRHLQVAVPADRRSGLTPSHPQPFAGLIRVISATYEGNCRAPQGNVTAHVAAQCDSQSSCTYVVDYRVIGDPAVGCSKDYVVSYDCGDGQTRTASIPPEAGYQRPVMLECPARTGAPPTTGGAIK